MTTLIQYPLDPTGASPTNLVENEPHTLTTRTYRCFATDYGAFFETSMVVTDVATGKPLTSDQFYCAEMYELPSARYGQEIDAIVVITDSAISNNVTVTYQALGGPYSTAATAIISQLNALQLDDRPISWPNIEMKPSEYPPSFHLHDIGDVYGFEYLVHAIDRVRAAIELGDAASNDGIYKYIDSQIAALNSILSTANAALTTHLNNFSNPHNVTAAQTGAMTAADTQSLVSGVESELQAHIQNQSNPHDVTAAQIDVYTKEQSDSNYPSMAQFNALLAAFNQHIQNQSNPHNVTAAQLGVTTTASLTALLAGYQPLSSAVNASNFNSYWDTRLSQRMAFTY
jgi:hypothetical protein